MNLIMIYYGKKINNTQIDSAKYIHVASSKKFEQETPKGVGFSFIWLPLVVFVTCKVSPIFYFIVFI